MHDRETFVLTFQAADRVGIVAGVSGFLAERDGFILDSQQYADLEAGRFFMRLEFTAGGSRFPSLESIRRDFAQIASRFEMDWSITDRKSRLKVIIAVSKSSHCLNDLLYRWSTGDLPIDICAVVSNHEDLRRLTEWHNIPFYYVPVSAQNRPEQEHAVLALMQQSNADLLILARYMQVLSDGMVQSLRGRCINIHHSFLPAFKGAQPYHRAHARGVKLIGATAHYVTAELDEGPIIEQAVERVDHRDTAEDMIRIGRAIEARVLSHAVRAAAERRIFLNGHRTIVFN
ncbi:formyltetrahydrofolate deformylase [Rhizorhabdus dicambivorans]|uniref:Formyltetrahydrofolate deformylase n=1 Tax=Rhizorhabdus dicambivorans TaxID=1850238 RepID=A0A2A4FP73_9SPHN|nr:formyltetrahydrofolate deformylase [Rhizorhabdus dicambivorans]ATE65151.1 formyltetrahydrofolate deformylase [Rhizorhabdus dicambivorans]PCE39899.1 formyltetrahydrofolate deformylase [Rhizorhabdus dicambivorans]